MVEHSAAFRRRRALNWFPLGLAYAFLYMGRYNLTVAKTSLGDLMTKEDFGVIFAIGTWVYGCAFLLNGPVTDKFGGRRAMLVSLSGALVANLAMGEFIRQTMLSADPGAADIRFWMSALYGVNMYFQSFAAVAIVKVNASWFHVRERGSFSGIFGTMISSGIFFAYTGNGWILDWVGKTADGLTPTWWVFYAPAALLGAIGLVELFLLRDRPSEAGHADFDTGDADSGSDGAALPVFTLMKRIFTHPVILTIAFIEFCTGVVRQGIMQWVPIYVKEVWVLPSSHWMVTGSWSWPVALPAFGVAVALGWFARQAAGRRRATLATSAALCALAPFLVNGWGGLLFVAGVVGGNAAGYVSDLFFQSRRAPAAGGLYVALTVCLLAMLPTLGGTTTEVGWIKEGKTELRTGDRIVAIAGATDLDAWADVAEAVACVPATCKVAKKLEGTGAPPPVWDPESCTCSSKIAPGAPAIAAAGVGAVPVSDGTLAATIVRDGQTMEIALKDPKPTMTAGDKRTLAAGPRLTVSPVWLGILSFVMSLAVIGTHGLLSGTATMDFGGRRAAATAVGVIDGFVYLGSGLQAWALGDLTSRDWTYWPMFLLPFGVIGSLLCVRIWHAKPGKAGH